MIADEIVEKLSERLVERMNKVNIFIIKRIARRIKKLGTITPSDTHAIIQIMDYGGDIDAIAKELSKATKLNVEEIYKIFDEVAKEEQHFLKKYYDYKEKEYIPWEENERLQRLVNAVATQTAEKFVNMSNTTAVGYTIKDMVYDKKNKRYVEKLVFRDINGIYKELVDEGIVGISQGKTTLDEEMNRIIKEIGKSGLKSVEYESGYTRRMDSAIRMNLSDGVRELHNELNVEFGEEFGADGVEITVHGYPAPDHAEVQGRQFSKEEFQKLQEDGIAKDVNGKEIDLHRELKSGRKADSHRPISKYNCYHRVFPIIMGLDTPIYSEKQLKKIKEDNEEGFEFDGKKYTLYSGSQLQRKIETEIRRNKDIQVMTLESGKMELAEESQRTINQLTDKYYELSKVSGLPTRLQRLKVSGYKPIDLKER